MTNLNRCYGQGYLHYITTSCYQCRPLLDLPSRRDLFLEVLEHVRRRYHFVVVGYVVMPEHVHLLLSEPERGNPSVMQAIKQGFARRILGRLRSEVPAEQRCECDGEEHIWQHRFYDFVLWTAQKRQEKLHYIHQNPVKQGLVEKPEQWRWSSARHYLLGERGPVLVNERVEATMKIRQVG
ncbi:MAG TPA: transposase [Candidatus Dormibacteraeota bacterium]|jgi:putative transposase|nr:transposase [Candidatus Dormibacteraeota bacterium]